LHIRDPETTVKNIVQWLQGKKFEKFGLASFGPLGLNRNQPDFGYITSTPKPNWGNFPIGPSLAKELNLTYYGFETDVNACAKA
jgi:fructokinase